MHPKGRRLVNRPAFLVIVAIVAIGAAVAGRLAVRRKAPSPPQKRISNGMSLSHSRGGTLYMQTNEIRNVVVNYRWSAGGTLTQVERVPTGAAGSGVLSPIYHTNRLNDFEGAGGLCLTCKTRKHLSTYAYNQDVV